ncbi:hypothetical protein DFH11DRAFT_21098 [Phellopilus nigrolimitatus]|nr:hypothetical protein DFH11DRAFT_21098 [Phellopilus nigrolimitatus]
MAIAQGSWNFTLPDTSSVFQYSPYSDGFGLTNGWQQGYTNSEFLTSPGEAGVGSPFHITSHPNASISLSFFGTGVTLLGEANCSYKVVLDGSERVFNDQPTISLFSEFGLANVTHNITLTAQPSANNQTLSFSAAQLMSSAADSLTPVRIDNQNTSLIVYNGNWTTRSDSQVPNSQNPSPFFETDDFGASASFNFTGRAVEVRGVKNYGWWTYSVTLDGNAFSNLNASSWWIVPDALLFYQDGLDENATHYLRITNSANQKFALSSITVHQSSDATSSSTTPSTSPS